MTGPAQLTLDLPVAAASGLEDFLVADGNRAAHGWIGRWQSWPGGVLALHGPPGSGKTHLLRIFLAASGGTLLDRGALAAGDDADPVGEAAALALDDADAVLATPAGETALLHLLNWARERTVPLLLAAAAPPARWPVALPDLGSRLRAIPRVGIEPPDDALMCAVIVKLFADRGVRVGADVPAWLVARIDRSLAAARDAVADIDARALGDKRRIDVPFLRAWYAEWSQPRLP